MLSISSTGLLEQIDILNKTEYMYVGYLKMQSNELGKPCIQISKTNRVDNKMKNKS